MPPLQGASSPPAAPLSPTLAQLHADLAARLDQDTLGMVMAYILQGQGQGQGNQREEQDRGQRRPEEWERERAVADAVQQPVVQPVLPPSASTTARLGPGGAGGTTCTAIAGRWSRPVVADLAAGPLTWRGLQQRPVAGSSHPGHYMRLYHPGLAPLGEVSVGGVMVWGTVGSPPVARKPVAVPGGENCPRGYYISPWGN